MAMLLFTFLSNATQDNDYVIWLQLTIYTSEHCKSILWQYSDFQAIAAFSLKKESEG